MTHTRQLYFVASISAISVALVAHDMLKTQQKLLKKLALDNIIMRDTLQKIIATRDPKLVDILNENMEFWSVIHSNSQ